MIGPVGSNNPGNGGVGETVGAEGESMVVVDGETIVEAVVEVEARRDAVGAVGETVVETVVKGGSG